MGGIPDVGGVPWVVSEFRLLPVMVYVRKGKHHIHALGR